LYEFVRKLVSVLQSLYYLWVCRKHKVVAQTSGFGNQIGLSSNARSTKGT